ncbi:unnamed protein product [Soboliphyme baturini]|uniref:LITAF domain-containing protein n=1 Tax=Soboliphyme baturini TaxID=241478 RepID=A0A183IQY8_9BILA|nr:unnamed protein product [Soboliphyme baturini]
MASEKQGVPLHSDAPHPYAPNPPYPQPAQYETTVIITAPTLGPGPTNVQCPHCTSMVLTETIPTAGTLSWLICILCLIFGLWFGCCLIPFCVPALQDVEHRCPNCKVIIGFYRRI